MPRPNTLVAAPTSPLESSPWSLRIESSQQAPPAMRLADSVNWRIHGKPARSLLAR
jgi:hypothetical protein